MKRLIIILFLFAPLYAQETDDKALRILKGTFYSAYILDTGLTFGLLQSDRFVESNQFWAPVIHNHGLTLALDFGIIMLSDLFLDKLYDWSRPLTYVVLAFAILAESYCINNNWKLYPR